eukprot:Polyplicarium_translucidae@DN1_c0_g1_i2.p2
MWRNKQCFCNYLPRRRERTYGQSRRCLFRPSHWRHCATLVPHETTELRSDLCQAESPQSPSAAINKPTHAARPAMPIQLSFDGAASSLRRFVSFSARSGQFPADFM